MFTDRTRIETFQRCPQERWWGYEFAGTGLEPAAHALPLLRGATVHGVFADILCGTPVEIALSRGWETFVVEVAERGVVGVDEGFKAHFLAEQHWLLSALVEAWVRVRLPIFRTDYDTLVVEREFEWALVPTEVVLKVRFDVLGRRRSDGRLVIPDFKTVSAPTEHWKDRFTVSDQMFCYCAAAADVLGELVAGFQPEGLVVGSRKGDVAKSSPFYGLERQYTDLCYGWAGPGGALSVEDKSKSKGWERVAAWDAGTSVAGWLDMLGAERLDAHFLTLPPLAPAPAEMARWKREVGWQELKIARRQANFPKTRGACVRNWGKCPFWDACWDPVVGSDPIASGLFVSRTPHHEKEEP